MQRLKEMIFWKDQINGSVEPNGKKWILSIWRIQHDNETKHK